MGRAEIITGRDRIWLVIRKMKCFTVADLEQLAEVPYATAYKYLYMLEKAGYLKKEARRGGKGCVKWQLLKDTGPKAPRVDQIFLVKDVNTGEIFKLKTGSGYE